jgi:hypothetical protein
MRPQLPAQADGERSVMCRMPGCRNRWACDVLFGKVCSYHDAELAKSHKQPAPQSTRDVRAALTPLLPIGESLRPFNERAERDDDPEF